MPPGLRFTADYRIKVRKATVTARTKEAAAVKGFLALLRGDPLMESTLQYRHSQIHIRQIIARSGSYIYKYAEVDRE